MGLDAHQIGSVKEEGANSAKVVEGILSDPSSSQVVELAPHGSFVCATGDGCSDRSPALCYVLISARIVATVAAVAGLEIRHGGRRRAGGLVGTGRRRCAACSLHCCSCRR
eukprot:352199-Chlamydomonas_euryale.AAC.3